MRTAGTQLAVDAVLFDLDGTLADTAADIAAALRLSLAELGVDPGERLLSLVDGSPLEEVFAVAVPGGTPGQLVRFVDGYRRHYQNGMLGQSRLFPGVRETLDALRALAPRPRLAIATSKRVAAARELVRGLEIESHFDAIAGSGGSEVPHKPAPDLLLAVLKDLGVPPSRALMVGDTRRDVIAGQRAGMRTAAVTYGLGAHAELSALRPDYLFEEFEELLLVLGAVA